MDERSLRLVAITDDLRDGPRGLVARAQAAVRGGATMIQVRLKDADARTLVEVTRALVGVLPVPVIVNDRCDVALAAGAAGVHLGPEDVPAAAIRTIVPAGFIVGASVGARDEIALADGADYVGVGPLYATTTKLDAGTALGVDGLRDLIERIPLPAVAIGGITSSNARAALDAGALGVAVIRSVFSAPDPEAAARSLADAIGS